MIYSSSWRARRNGFLLSFLIAASWPAQAVPTEYTTAFTYHTSGTDGAGRIATVDGPRSGAADTTTYTYDTAGNLSAITNPIGHITQLMDYTSRRRPGKVTDANGVETVLGYHMRGWVETITVKDPGGVTADATTYLTYDPVGQLIGITLPDSSYLGFEYDAAQRLDAIQNNLGERIEYTLDNAGNRTLEVIKNSGGSIVKTQTRVFDQMSRLVKTVGADLQETAYNYDAMDNTSQVTDGELNATTYGFDALNRMVSQTDPDNYDVVYSYDSSDRIKTVTDQRGLITTYLYDAFDNLISQNSPDTGITTFDYDNAGNRVQQTDARGVVTNFAYDDLNRLVSVSYPTAAFENVTYTYDSAAGGNYGKGRLTRIIDESGEIDFVYDHRGNLTQKNYIIETISYNIGFGFDLADKLTQISYPSGRIVDYVRDSLGRVSGVTTKENAGSVSVDVVSNVGYLPFGPMNNYTYGNGISQTLAFDQDYRVEGIGTSGVSTIIDLSYNYDNNSNITVLDDLKNIAKSQNFQYDNENRLQQAVGSYGQLDYVHDGVGNRTQKISANGSTVTEDYTYSANSNQLDRVDIDDGSTQTVRTLNYDDNGNLIQDDQPTGEMLEMGYNDANRYNVAIKNSALPPRATYLYNALGQRTAKVAIGGNAAIKDHYHYDESGMLLGITNETGTLKREYIYLAGMKVASLIDDSYANEWDGFDAPPSNNTSPTANAGTDISVLAGATITLNGSSSSDPDGPITYLWSGQDLSDPTAVSPTVVTVDAGATTTRSYTLTVTDAGGLTDSNTITVVLYSATDDSDVDSLLDGWEFTHFGDITSYTGADDPDGDGITNVNEYLQGTDPNVANTNTSPTIGISTPVSGTTIPAGTSLTLNGSSSDTEDGSLTSSVQWNSSLDGVLGTGTGVIVPSLSVGSHIITASVTDSGGASVSAAVSVTVNPVGGSTNIDIIVDNQNSNTSSVGTWAVSSRPNPWEGQSVFSGTPTDTFRWTPTIVEARSYDVYAWWTSGTVRVANAPYTISHDGGTSVITVDQITGSLGGQWNLLGTYSFTPGAGQYIELSGVNGTAAADAVRLVSGALPVVVDNQNANITKAGSWYVSSGTNPWQHQSEATDDVNATFRWSPNLTEAGDYKVSVWWTWHANRSTTVPYRVNHAGGVATHIVDQHNSALHGRWVELGIYTFVGDGSGYVEVSGENGQASADAVQLTKVSGGSTNTTPSLAITTSAVTITEGDSVTFSGSGSDTEDGDLTSIIQWSSSLDGALGSGTGVIVPNLSVGSHVITASVSDSGGATASATTSVIVNAASTIEVVVDNQDTNTSSVGTWVASAATNPWAGQSIYNNDSNGRFRWSPNLTEAGDYKVSVWWTWHANRSTTVPYRISHAGGIATHTVNQHNSALGGTWVELGIYTFVGDGSGYVEVSSENGQASADAVRLVKQ
jgi:YD repeat-containing protein